MVFHSDMPRALITGVRGFTGHYLAQALEAAGYEVFGTAHDTLPASSRLFKVDLCDREQVRLAVAAVRPD